jgi:hypothetical protein
MPTTEDLILDELRALRTGLDELRGDLRNHGERTATSKAQIYPLIGNGSPGRVTRLESAVEQLAQWRWWVIGAAAGGSGPVSVIAWIVMAARK